MPTPLEKKVPNIRIKRKKREKARVQNIVKVVINHSNISLKRQRKLRRRKRGRIN